MSIRVQWENLQTGSAIRMIFEEGWTLQAYYHSIAALDAMMYARNEPINVIMDMSASTNIPIMRVPRGRQLDENTVLSRANRLLVVNGGYFTPQTTQDIEEFNTLDAAYAALGERIPA